MLRNLITAKTLSSFTRFLSAVSTIDGKLLSISQVVLLEIFCEIIFNTSNLLDGSQTNDADFFRSRGCLVSPLAI